MRYNAINSNLCDFTSQIRDVMAHKTPTYKYNFADPSLSRRLNKDTMEKSNTADGKDDGKISFKEKLKNFGKGLIAPIKTMFSSPKNIAITALSAAACAGLIAVTGGAAAPVLVALGITGGVFQIGKGIYKQATAKTDEQAQKAWQDIGSGTFTTGVSVFAAKSALKANKVDTKGMSTLKAVGKCFKDLKTNTVNSFTNAKSNIANLGNTLKFWKKTPADSTTDAAASETQTSEGTPTGKIKGIFKKIKDKIFKEDKSSKNSETAPKADTKPATDAKAETAPKADTKPAADAKAESTPKADTKPAADAKAETAPKADTKPAADAKAETAPKADIKPAVDAQTESTPKADTKPTADAKAETAPKADTKPAVDAQTETAPKADTKPVANAQAEAAPKADTKPAVDAQTKSAPEADIPTSETVINNQQENGESKSIINSIKEFGHRFKELLEVFGIGIDEVK